jgi:hypothetical protein
MSGSVIPTSAAAVMNFFMYWVPLIAKNLFPRCGSAVNPMWAMNSRKITHQFANIGLSGLVWVPHCCEGSSAALTAPMPPSNPHPTTNITKMRIVMTIMTAPWMASVRMSACVPPSVR